MGDEKRTWGEITRLLEQDVGYISPNLLHFTLKKLRNKNKIRFIQLGDLIYYQKILI